MYIERSTILEQLDRIDDTHRSVNKAVDYVMTLKENNKLESERLLAFTYSKRGNIRVCMGDYQGAMKDYELAIDILENLSNEGEVKATELISQYLHFGIVYDQTNKFEEAINYYTQALEKIDELKRQQIIINQYLLKDI